MPWREQPHLHEVLGSLTLGGRACPADLLIAGIVAAIVTEVVVGRRMARRDVPVQGDFD